MTTVAIKKKYVNVPSLIKKITNDDTLFKGSYTIDPYQNCSYGCMYCDSTTDDFIYIKQNALDLLKKELINLPKKRVIIGSVHDPYQPIEEELKLTRSVIKFLLDHEYPIHILTKSNLVLRDIDLFNKKINDVIVTFSAVSDDPTIVSTIEKNAPTFLSRLRSIQILSSHNLCTGLALIPLLPCIIEESIESMIQMADHYQSRYVIFAHLFLKGDQKTRFLSYIKSYHPECLSLYKSLFKESIYPMKYYQEIINKKIEKICGSYHLPTSLPL